jgi:hypothetical protein
VVWTVGDSMQTYAQTSPKFPSVNGASVSTDLRLMIGWRRILQNVGVRVANGKEKHYANPNEGDPA